MKEYVTFTQMNKAVVFSLKKIYYIQIEKAIQHMVVPEVKSFCICQIANKTRMYRIFVFLAAHEC